MPADLAMVLLAARRRRVRRESAGGGRPDSAVVSDDGRIRHNPDGSMSMRIGSMDSLRSFLGQGGPPVGRQL